MSKKVIRILALLVSAIFISASAIAQLSSPSSDFKVATAYSIHDSIFIFNQSPTAKKGEISATVPGGGPARFEWSEYDSANRIFLPVFKTEDNVGFSQISDLKAGGYTVHVTKPGLDTTMIAWVFLNDFAFSVEKDNKGEVHFYRRTCEFTNLQANATPSVFKYFNPSTGDPLKLANSLKFTWTASPSTEDFNYTGAKIWIEGDDLPSDDTEYTGRATDKFNLWKEDKVKYITIIPKADFDTTYEKKYETYVSAPLNVVFKNNSKNAVKYTWIYGDGDTTFLDEPQKDPDPHVYLIAAKEYHVKLIAESKEGCIREDTVLIKVDSSMLVAPNVFTPNGDGQNDYYEIKNVSLHEFHLTIYSRSGRKVYEFHGPDINHWEGWDGNMGNSEASAGIYFYVVEAIGWEKSSVKYKPKKYSGYFYLFR